MSDIWCIGERVKKTRNEESLSQEELGEKIGVSRQTIGKWETGSTYPDMGHLEKLCQLFKCDLAFLLGEIDTRLRVVADVAAITGLSEKAITILRSLTPPHRADFIEVLNKFISCEDGTAFQKLSELAVTLFVLANPSSFEEYASPSSEYVRKTAHDAMLWHGSGFADAYGSIKPEDVIEYQMQQVTSRLIAYARTTMYTEEVSSGGTE